MSANTTVNDEKKKDAMALGCIAISVVGLILGIMFPRTIGDFFSVGAILSFVAFLLSLGTVKNHGSNLLQLIAFNLSMISMTASIFRSGMM